ncbi:MAG: DUF2510 domain-containing protein [Actinomycetota bacterium]
MTNSGPEAGWYPDPTVPGTERWWDGYEWSDAVRAVPPPEPAPPAPTPLAPAAPQPAGMYGAPNAPGGPGVPAGPGAPPGVPGPPPALGGAVGGPQKSSGGCGTVAILVVVIGIVVLGIIGLASFLLLARAAEDAIDEVETALEEATEVTSVGSEPDEPDQAADIDADSAGGDSAAAESGDVLSCTRVDPETVVLEVVNSSSEISNYAITVGYFDDSGTRLADEPKFVNNLRPGERSIEEHFSFEEQGTVCEVLNVDRFDSLSLAGDISEVSECVIGSEPDFAGDFTGTLTAMNDTADTSDYVVDVAFFDADGIRRGTGSSFIEAVRPGESAPGDIFSTVDFAAGYTCEVVAVSRTAS